MSKEIISELNRMKDLFGYKKGQVISEQEFLSEAEIPYPEGISKQAVDKIMSVSAQNKKNLQGSYLAPLQQREIDKEFGQGTYQKFLSGGGQSVFDKKNTFKSATNSEQANTSQAQPAQQAPATATKGSNISEYPECVRNFGKPTASKSGTQYSINGTGDWKDYYFYPNGKYGSFKINTPPPHGTYSCNGKIIVMGTPDKTVVQQKKSVTIPKPKELKDVKHFQDWLDQNHPGWHKKYKTLNKSVPKGYGIFGPNTSAAWNQYKNEYLNVKKTLDTDTDSLEMGDEPKKVETPQQNDLLWSNPTDIQGNPVNPAPPKVS